VPPLSAAEARSLRRLVVVTAIAVVALDAVTKALAVQYLTGRGSVSILGGVFHLELYRNFAGPRNTFQGHPVLVSLLAAAGVLAIAAAAFHVRSTAAAVAIGLLLGGGVGNLLDRLLRAPGPLRGGAIDWLRPGWSSGHMNVADLSIAAGVVIAVCAALLALSRRSPRDLPAD